MQLKRKEGKIIKDVSTEEYWEKQIAVMTGEVERDLMFGAKSLMNQRDKLKKKQSKDSWYTKEEKEYLEGVRQAGLESQGVNQTINGKKHVIKNVLAGIGIREQIDRSNQIKYKPFTESDIQRVLNMDIPGTEHEKEEKNYPKRRLPWQTEEK